MADPRLDDNPFLTAPTGVGIEGSTMPPLGSEVIGRTAEGRPMVANPDGSYSTERSITVTHPSINNGRATNIPSMFGGREVPEEEAIRRIAEAGGVDPETGRALEGYDSIDQAVAAARARSAAMPARPGTGIEGSAPATDSMRGIEQSGNAEGLFGYEMREPHPSERAFFEKNPGVAGMASEDGRIVLNPTPQAGVDSGAVAKNEALRLLLRDRGGAPEFAITDEQRKAFAGTPYEGDDEALRATILGRLYSGDPSAKGTPEQKAALQSVLAESRTEQDEDPYANPFTGGGIDQGTRPSGYGEALSRGIDQAGYRAVASGGGLVQAAGEWLGIDAATAKGEEIGRFSRELYEARERASGLQDESAPYYVSHSVETLFGNVLPTVAVGIATRNPNLALTMLGGAVFGEKYSSARADGRTREQASQDAAFYALSEALTERIPLGVVLGGNSRAVREALTKLTAKVPRFGRAVAGKAAHIGEAATLEGLSEIVNAAAQRAYDTGVVDENGTLQDVLRAMVDDEALREYRDSMIIGAMVGGGMATITPRPVEQPKRTPKFQDEPLRQAPWQPPGRAEPAAPDVVPQDPAAGPTRYEGGIDYVPPTTPPLRADPTPSVEAQGSEAAPTPSTAPSPQPGDVYHVPALEAEGVDPRVEIESVGENTAWVRTANGDRRQVGLDLLEQPPTPEATEPPVVAPAGAVDQEITSDDVPIQLPEGPEGRAGAPPPQEQAAEAEAAEAGGVEPNPFAPEATQADAPPQPRPKDPAEKARDRWQRERTVDPRSDDILTAVAKLGGWRRDDAGSEGVDEDEFDRRGHKILHVFTKGGRTADDLAISLAQHGWPFELQGRADKNAFLRAMDEALRGRAIKSDRQAVDEAAIASEFEERLGPDAYAEAPRDLLADPVDDIAPGGMVPETEYSDDLDAFGRRVYELARRADAIEEGAGESILETAAIRDWSDEQTVDALEEWVRDRADRSGAQAPARDEGAAVPPAQAAGGGFDLTAVERPAAGQSGEEQGDLLGAADPAEPGIQSNLVEQERRRRDREDAGRADAGYQGGGPLFDRADAEAAGQADIEDALTEGVKATKVEQAAAEAATSPENDRPEPTEAMKQAGNYKVGKLRLHGFEISIENPAGTRRRPEWPPLAHPYGYLNKTTGKDKDHIDVFLGPLAESENPRIFVVDQRKPDGTGFDEAKVMFGFDSAVDARRGYLANYSKGWKGAGPITAMTLDEFRAWTSDPNATKRMASRWTKTTKETPDETGPSAGLAPDSVPGQPVSEDDAHPADVRDDGPADRGGAGSATDATDDAGLPGEGGTSVPGSGAAAAGGAGDRGVRGQGAGTAQGPGSGVDAGRGAGTGAADGAGDSGARPAASRTDAESGGGRGAGAGADARPGDRGYRVAETSARTNRGDAGANAPQVPTQGMAPGAEMARNFIRAKSFPQQLANFLKIPRQAHPARASAYFVDRSPAAAKRLFDRVRRHTQALSNVIQGESFAKKPFGSRDAKTQRLVLSHMLGLSHNREVLDAVVQFIPVDVMDNLVRAKLSPDVLLQDRAVLENTLSTGLGSQVSTPSDFTDALVRAVALGGAEVSTGAVLSDLMGPAEKAGPASSTLNRRHGATPGSSGVSDAGDAGTSPASPIVGDVTKTDSFSRWFGASQVVDENGAPLIVYHQTSRGSERGIYSEGFDLGRPGARAQDYELPDGVFLKPTTQDIGVGSSGEDAAQIPLYASLQNPLIVADRAALVRHLRKDEEYLALADEAERSDREGAREFDALEKSEFKNATGDEAYAAALKATDDYLARWRETNIATASKARARATEVLASQGHDGVILEQDAGSFGRKTKTIIAFRPEQVKSATGNTGAFNPDVRSIRYSPNTTPSPGRMTVARAEAIIAPVLERWTNGPGVRVVQSRGDLPAGMRPPGTGTPEGVWDARGNTVWLVADMLPTPADVHRVLAHEAVGHASLEQVLGDDYAPIMRVIDLMRRNKDKAAQEIFAQLRQRYPGMFAKDGRILDRNGHAREFMALLAERRPGEGGMGKLWRRIQEAVTRFLRSLGLRYEPTMADLQVLLSMAESRLQAGREAARASGAAARASAGQPMFARASNDQLPPFDVATLKTVKAGDTLAGGMTVGGEITNQGSIESTLGDDYEIVGLRELPMDEWGVSSATDVFYEVSDVRRAQELADTLRDSKTIDPLIVVVQPNGEPYILEGNHRLAALGEMGAKSFPALVVRDTTPDAEIGHRFSLPAQADAAPREVTAPTITPGRVNKARFDADTALAWVDGGEHAVVTGLIATGKKVRGADVLGWLREYAGKPVQVVAATPTAQPFYRKMEARGVIAGWTEQGVGEYMAGTGAARFSMPAGNPPRYEGGIDAPELLGGAKGTTPPAADIDITPKSFSEANRRIREQDRPLWNKAKALLRRNFAAGGLLPKSVFDEKITRDSQFEVVELYVRHLVGVFEHAVKKAYGRSTKRLDARTQEMLREGLAGRMDASLPEEVRVPLLALRQYIDTLSTQYVAILESQAEALRAQGKDGAARADLIDTIRGNIGEYVHRSYRAFDDPSWPKKVPDPVLDAARAYLIQRHQENGEGEVEAQRLAEVALHEILKNGTAYESMEGFIKESKLGAKDLSVLKRRKQIAPEIRALLGEYTDPRLNFAKSATKMGRLIWNQRFLDKVREQGMGVFLFEGTNRPPEATVQIAGDASSAYEPLNGLWTFPEVNQSFRDALDKEQMANWYRTIVQINGVVKVGKTVQSPTTAMRNWQSGFFFTIANGHFDLSHAGKSLRGLREYFTQQGSGARLAYLRKLKELGVVYDTPYAGEMMRLLDDSRIEEQFLHGDAKLKFREAFGYAQKFYQFGDDFWKIIGFENEKRLLMKHAGMDEAAAEREAAERIRNTYPTYSMVGRAMKSLRRFPLAGTFVSFPSEIIRTSYHIVRYAALDMKTPGMRPLAIRRIAGLAIVSGFAYALQELAKSLLDVDDDEEEAIRRLSAPWSRNSNLLFIGRQENGRLRYIDLSFVDPYNFWKRPLTAVLRDQPWEDAATQSAREVLEPFLGTDIAAGALFEIMANKKESGGRVFNEHAMPQDQLVDIANHLRKTLQPGLAANIERTIRAARDEVTRSGRKYDMGDEMAAWAGWRVTTMDPKVSLYFRTYSFSDAKRDATSALNATLREPNMVSDLDIKKAFNRAAKIRRKAYEDMFLIIESARKAGVNARDLAGVLRSSGVSQRDVRFLMMGRMPPWKPSSGMLLNAQKKAGALFGADARREVMRRYLKVNQLANKDRVQNQQLSR